MTDHDLARIGAALHGRDWKLPLSCDLHVAIRTIHRWAARDNKVPRRVWPELAVLCRQHGRVLEQLAEELEALAVEAAAAGDTMRT